MSTKPDGVEEVRDFVEFVARSAHSVRQRRRLASAVDAPATEAEITALRAIDAFGPLTFTDLAGRVGLDRTTVSRNAARLEGLGLVERRADTDDRRRAWLTSTPRGRDLLARMRAVARNDFAVALDGWSAHDRAELARLLTRLRGALSSLEFDEAGWAVGPLAQAGDPPDRTSPLVRRAG